MLIVGVCGSSAPSQRTRALVDYSLETIKDNNPKVETDIIDLSEVTLEFCDGRAVEEYDLTTQRVLQKIAMADGYIFSSPMYRGIMTGALKNLLDLIPNDSIKGKTAGLIATGGSAHHYLGVDLGLRTVMAFFQVHTLPGVLYQYGFDVKDGKIVQQEVKEQVARFGADLVELTEMTDGKVLGPSLY